VSLKSKYSRTNIEFNLDGTLKFVELDIMNLNNIGLWEKVIKRLIWNNKLFDLFINILNKIISSRSALGQKMGLRSKVRTIIVQSFAKIITIDFLQTSLGQAILLSLPWESLRK
jgi:hypothetical protein